MITPIDGYDDADGADDELVVLLRPEALHLTPPPGAFERSLRVGARRRFRRVAVGGGAGLAVVAAILVPVLLTTGPSRPARVTPIAPPASVAHTGSASPFPTPSATPSAIPSAGASVGPSASASSVGPATSATPGTSAGAGAGSGQSTHGSGATASPSRPPGSTAQPTPVPTPTPTARTTPTP
ncbi:hypothetical protein [Streptacidiphilus anmyonensis]|uniref:hypothetical protein n=1 Tax=Streptacidiphilus anmyonensis TaxID=405782 RepID=UPI0005A88212|nr:hypothetical protein [Streptacidiphilus anmyonensis]